jgi:hypothetical protein
MTTMEEVPWQLLHHAYGPASDVPAQLEALRSPDEERRRWAMSHLGGNIYHQGTRWQASSAAVPFLVTMVEDPSTPERDRVLRLLHAVAIGDRRDNDLPFDADRVFAARASISEEGLARLIRLVYHEEDSLDDEEGFALSTAADARWAYDAYMAAAGHAETVAGWVRDADPEVASRAAALLAWFPTRDGAIDALLSVPDDHPFRDARASANLALAHLPTIDVRVDHGLRSMLDSYDRLVAVTAAVALVYRLGETIPDRALSTLAEAFNEELPSGVTGWDRAPRGFVALALQRLGLN